jgi:soluble lytic murein transglycosylase-like protein
MALAGLLLILPVTASCDLESLGVTALRGARANLLFAADVAPRLPGSFARDPEARERFEEIAAFLRSFRTGLPRAEELAVADAILEASERSRVDYRLILAIIKTESTCRNWAVSPKGAFGLMQIMPGTARDLAAQLSIPWTGSPSLFNPATNVRLGTAYLARLRERLGGLPQALVAYNRGPAIPASAWPADPASDSYVRKVMGNYEALLGQGEGARQVAGTRAPLEAGPRS